MIKKLCSYPGCHKVVEAGVKYCDKHRETDRKKYREYKQRRMRDEQEARRQQFYNSKAWEQFRAAQAAAQLGIDICSVFVLLPAAYLRRAFYFNSKYDETGGGIIRNCRTFHKDK